MKTMVPSSPTSGSSNANNKLFIGGLSYETTDESLSQHFSQFGQVLSAVVLRDQETSRSRGFGFVTFVHPESAQAAIGHHHHIVDGRKVESKFAVPRKKNEGEDEIPDAPPTPQSKLAQQVVAASPGISRATPTPPSGRSSPVLFSPNTTSSTSVTGRSGDESMSPVPLNGDIIVNKIFVGGLRYATSHEVLRNYFEQFGEVETAQVIFNRDTKKSRGFGFVVFRDPSSVDKVLARQKSNPPTIEGKQVEVKTCVARQDSGSGASSPRAVPQTPIVTRSDSHSSLTSSSSVQRAVSATPVRPVNSVFSPQPLTQSSTQLGPIHRDPWGLSSPVVFDTNNEAPNGFNHADRRPSFASSSVRSSSPYTLAPGGMDVFDNNFSQFSAPRGESPSLTRLQTFPTAPPSIQRPREDSAFTFLPIQQNFFPQSRESAFSVPTDNHDNGLFDMSAFSTSPPETMKKPQGADSPPPPSNFPNYSSFRPVDFPPSNNGGSNVLSPQKTAAAKSPLFDSSLSPRIAFSPFVASPGDSKIW